MMVERGAAEQVAVVHARLLLGFVVRIETVFDKNAVQGIQERRGRANSITVRRLAAKRALHTHE